MVILQRYSLEDIGLIVTKIKEHRWFERGDITPQQNAAYAAGSGFGCVDDKRGTGEEGLSRAALRDGLLQCLVGQRINGALNGWTFVCQRLDTPWYDMNTNVSGEKLSCYLWMHVAFACFKVKRLRLSLAVHASSQFRWYLAFVKWLYNWDWQL